MIGTHAETLADVTSPSGASTFPRNVNCPLRASGTQTADLLQDSFPYIICRLLCIRNVFREIEVVELNSGQIKTKLFFNLDKRAKSVNEIIVFRKTQKITSNSLNSSRFPSTCCVELYLKVFTVKKSNYIPDSSSYSPYCRAIRRMPYLV